MFYVTLFGAAGSFIGWLTMKSRISEQRHRPTFQGKPGRHITARDSSERKTKHRLAIAINQILRDMHLSQAESARRLGINQPKISALVHFRLDGFSVERLINFINALGRDVEIVIRSKPGTRRSGKTLITAA